MTGKLQGGSGFGGTRGHTWLMREKYDGRVARRAVKR
jgi:hypothetical protein